GLADWKKWTWESTRPGMTHLPCPSTTWAPGGTGVEADGPTATMRSPAMRTVRSLSVAAPPSRPGWTTVAPVMARVAEPELRLEEVAPQAAAKAARRSAVRLSMRGAYTRYASPAASDAPRRYARE